MKKILLTPIVLLSLFACQSGKLNTAKIQPASNDELSLSARQVMVSLDNCYSSETCRMGLDSQINDWLVEKNYLNEIPHSITEEVSQESELTFDGTIGDKSISSIPLSSNYLNNALIKGALNEWLTWKRPQLIHTWQYYQFLRKDMVDSFKQYDIDESLVLAILAQESGGKVHSSSPAGAGGLFQLMPATAKRLGLHGKIGDYDLRFNPKQSAKAAAKYIDEQNRLYAGDKAKVLAAYNSGENRFARLNKRYKNKSIWEKSFFYELPRETRHYVPVVLAAMLIFQDPNKFNVSLDTLNVETRVVQLPNDSSLSELAVCLGQDKRTDGWFRILRNLNSGVKADKIINANTDIVIPKILSETFTNNCQDKELMAMAKSFHESDFKGNQGLFRYRVKQGDSLYKIVKKFRCTSKKELARINHLKSPRYLIRAGKHLSIPQC